MKKTLLLFLTAFILFGCSKPVPDDKLLYVGEWVGNDTYLLILADGTVSYKRRKNNNFTTSIDAPIKEFDGDDFVVGIPFITTTFKVTQPPYKKDGSWKMVVDGVLLNKSI